MRYHHGISLAAFGRGNRRLIAHIKAHTGLTWKKTGGAAAGAAFFWPTIGHWAPTAITTAAAGWTIAAIVAGQQPDTGDASPTEDTAGNPKPDDAPDPAAFLTALHQLLPGPKDRAHLTQIADHLYGDPTATARLREQCAAAGVPVRRGVRAPGGGVSTGITAADLPPLPDPPPPGLVAVVSAGHNEQHDQQQQQQHAIQPDPEGDPHRWVVRHTIRRVS